MHNKIENKEQKNTKILALNKLEECWWKCCDGKMFPCESHAQFFVIWGQGSSTSLEKRYNLNVEFPKW